MVSSWLIKILLGIAIVGFALIELGSPLIARAQADDAAHEVADEAALVLAGADLKAMEQRCQQVADDKSVELLQCQLNAEQKVEVRVRKEALSVLLKKWSVTEGWYQVEVSATADPR